MAEFRWQQGDWLGNNPETYATLYYTPFAEEETLAEVERKEIGEDNDYMFEATVNRPFGGTSETTVFAESWEEAKSDILDYIRNSIEDDIDYLKQIFDTLKED